MSKIFSGIIILSLIVQIVFSFFYSSSIVTQNNQLDLYQKEADQLQLEVESAWKQVADLTSITHLVQSTPSASLKPIIKSININF
ncbi:MAG TPA: hypothetical protein PKZ29_00270 [Candidatus Woesebacteria bacterium]|jgi:peptidoglycan hydrolase CwlO-like protein|nr:hypothetical protein [Candidatus Woesebacteria bacterium]HOG37337.1 hypothetical protein [Candidatus Woesebacteria bacterium]